MILKKIFSVVRRLGFTNMFDDEAFVRMQYAAMMNRKLNLANPRDFNEKIQWLKLHYRDPLMIRCADKWAVREFVKERIGDKYLAPCIGVYENVNEIPYDELPKKFVLKATHGSGWNIICPDKAKLNWTRAKRRLRKWLKSDFSRVGREWQYHDIKPRIICEEFLTDTESSVLRDYKLFTFRGETKYIWVDYTEVVDDATNKESVQSVGYAKPKISNGVIRYRNIYDHSWNFMPGRGSLYPNKETPLIKRPECLAEMLDVAKKLASDFPQCRVDLYVLGGKRIVFGELTFSSGNGCNAFYPQGFCDELGSYIDLTGLDK